MLANFLLEAVHAMYRGLPPRGERAQRKQKAYIVDALSAYFLVYMTQFKIHNASIIDAEWWNKFVTSIVCNSTEHVRW